MRCVNRLVRTGASDRGSAALEFVSLGLALVVPLVYLVLVLGQLQAGMLAAEGAARQAARQFVQLDSAARADWYAGEQVRLAAADFGFTPGQVSWSKSYLGPCLAPGSRTTVDVTIRVPLPFAPSFLNIDRFTTILVRASATQTVSRFGARP